MNIFAIGDLHLSGNPPYKPMDIFGDNWINHWQKIKNHWLTNVAQEDTVLIAGDTSWAMNFSDALIDLKEIDNLPGKKIFIKGNHDFWWSSLKKMHTETSDTMFFIHNNYHVFSETAFCGSRGWLTPNDEMFTEKDMSIYLKELERTERSLAIASNSGYKNIILLLHYPPLYKDLKQTAFTNLCKKYKVSHCIYGHLHNQSTNVGYNGILDSTEYHLVSADFLNFQLKKI